ncbi:Rieske (2Fe-2S) protein [Halothiobacillus diazotrophicus]|uniref:Rieske (2Fe-2S) protein n=2 Tax=Halothiobacillus diazotrophicus TaxID=1860122 RepID=A0A191ZKA7_9GAMM|nr:Rieske (2Fe-2S) protein [Halothiobacillus diazotrophicus]
MEDPQLPIDWYFDPVIHQRELDRLFALGPGYVGHALMTPAPGDYRVLERFDDARMLVNADGRIHLLGNVCRHRQALMLEGAGTLPRNRIICPLHRWTYDNQGHLIAAPKFAEKPCLDLERTGLQNWQGLLFAGPRDVTTDLAGMAAARALDFSGYRLDRIESTVYPINWKTFIEVYLEDYHVAPAHPGLRQFVRCEDLHWEYGDWWSVQTVSLNPLDQNAKTGSAPYQAWQKALNARTPDQVSYPYGAIWFTYYPGLMIEWYPEVLVISSLEPQGIESTRNIVEFYYPADIVAHQRGLIEAQQAAYHETAVEDEIICVKMQQGRKALYEAGKDEHGPYQLPLEEGMRHFHQFLRRTLSDTPPPAA